jgi:hypothetical protein
MKTPSAFPGDTRQRIGVACGVVCGKAAAPSKENPDDPRQMLAASSDRDDVVGSSLLRELAPGSRILRLVAVAQFTQPSIGSTLK